MTDKSKKDSKRCPKNKKAMLVYGSIKLGSSIISAFALAVIALGFCSIMKESKVFNECVQEIRESGTSTSSAVRFCNGGT